MKEKTRRGGYAFGTFQGVFTPSILTIIGVVMYLRFGWMLGNLGLAASLAMVTLGNTITFLTGLSISSLATNMRMKGGGAYFMLSRSFGAETGAAIGIPLAISQAIAVSFYVAGFAEALVNSGLPVFAGLDIRIAGLCTLAVLALVASFSADLALKTQYFIMGAIAFSLVSFFLGGPPQISAAASAAPEPQTVGFWTVFAVFFPAVTGILSGVGMSGDLENPGKSIPAGTIGAILAGYLVYMSIPVFLAKFVPDAAILKSDTMIMAKCARWPFAILAGVWAATLSSAVGSFLGAPRVFQALARDRMLPRAFAKGWGETDDPRIASLFCFAVAAAGLWFGDIDAIAPILTMFNLSTYALLNLSAALESAMDNPSWRPTFRTGTSLHFAGFAACLGAMFMISPGWTFAALGCETAIWWFAKRRALRARWGDMRTGLYVAAARSAILKLEGLEPDLRNWRPDVLSFVELPVKSDSEIELAKAISAGRGMVTLASIVPEAAGDLKREAQFAASLRSAAKKRGLAALARVHAANDAWSGMRDLVRCYGFGPFVPDTVILGIARDKPSDNAFAMAAFLHRRGRNAVFVESSPHEDGHGDIPHRGTIDVWWRGGNGNGPFMLALARLAVRSSGKRAKIRLCRIAESDGGTEEAGKALASFVEKIRVDAEVHVIARDGTKAPVETIAKTSSGAALAFVGLRPPREGESEESYAEYFRNIHEAISPSCRAVFALAAEGVGFRRIFKE